jgi:hypothetical protein
MPDPRLHNRHRTAGVETLKSVNTTGRNTAFPICKLSGERLGVAEGLGMPTAPGSPGWLVAVGEEIEAAWKEAQKQAQNEPGNRP